MIDGVVNVTLRLRLLSTYLPFYYSPGLMKLLRLLYTAMSLGLE